MAFPSIYVFLVLGKCFALADSHRTLDFCWPHWNRAYRAADGINFDCILITVTRRCSSMEQAKRRKTVRSAWAFSKSTYTISKSTVTGCQRRYLLKRIAREQANKKFIGDVWPPSTSREGHHLSNTKVKARWHKPHLIVRFKQKLLRWTRNLLRLSSSTFAAFFIHWTTTNNTISNRSL